MIQFALLILSKYDLRVLVLVNNQYWNNNFLDTIDLQRQPNPRETPNPFSNKNMGLVKNYAQKKIALKKLGMAVMKEIRRK